MPPNPASGSLGAEAREFSATPTSSDRLDRREIATLSSALLSVEAGDGGANERVVKSPGCVSDGCLGSSKRLLWRSFAGRGGGARELNAVSR